MAFQFSTLAVADSSTITDHPVVGAIRWDAWVGDASPVGLAVEKTLSPEPWHYRLPFYAKVLAPNQVEVRGNTQAVMDQEIALAQSAGLDYWAFCLYSEDDAMTRGGLDLYFHSVHVQEINFCVILQGGQASTWVNNWPQQRARLLDYFRKPTYQQVCGGRPLLFLLQPAAMVSPSGFRDFESARAAIEDLRQKAVASGMKAPYVVAMDWSPAATQRDVEKLGLDAISSYASNGGEKAATYAHLTSYTQSNWDAYATTGDKVVPWVTTGWDRRPRVENPVFWEKPYSSPDNYYERAAPLEIAGHLKAALNWNASHPGSAEANAVIIYAWNEFDEGGWLDPTLEEGNARLDAIRSVLRPNK